MNLYKQIEYNGYHINIYYNDDARSPREAYDNLGTLYKTLCIVFVAEFEWVAKIGFLIGNDLETSEVLYSALLNPKNADFKCKGSELVWIIIILVL